MGFGFFSLQDYIFGGCFLPTVQLHTVQYYYDVLGKIRNIHKPASTQSYEVLELFSESIYCKKYFDHFFKNKI